MTDAVALEPRARAVRPRPPWRHALSRFLRHPFGVLALVLLVVLVAAGLLAPHLTPYYSGELGMDLLGSAKGPRLEGRHFFGTDDLGRDVFAQVLYGLHVSAVTALEVAAVTTAGGAVVGAAAGYAGGWLDTLLMRVVDLVVTIPTLAVLVVAVVYFQALSPRNVGWVLMLTMWPVVARVVRASVASLREREFVEAAHAAGAGPLRVIARHLLPNSAGVIVVAATSVMGIAITLESTVDFFQFGTHELDKPTLGNLVADGSRYGLFNGPRGWWTWLFPALVLVLFILCLNVVGDALDESLASTAS